MAFPSSIDTYTAIQGTSLVATVDHANQHNVGGSAVVAIENKLGLGSGSASVNALLVGSGAGTTAWGTVVNSLTLGTPSITGGTINSPVIGTPSITTISNTGVITLPTATDTLVGKATTDIFTNKTIGDTLSMTTGAITQAGTAAHITLTPGASKLVRIAVYSDANTSTSYVNNAIIIRGWARVTGAAAGSVTKAITYGITLAAYGFPLVSCAGNNTAGTEDPTTSAIGDTKTIAFATTSATTGFSINIAHGDATNISATIYYVVNYLVIGTI